MKPRHVTLFVFDGMADWEASFAIAGINAPRFQRQPGSLRIRTCGLSEVPIVTLGGMRITPDDRVDAVTPASSAMLILPGGTAWERGGNNAAGVLASAFLAAGTPVAAICGATWRLAEMGELDTRRHTSNSSAYLAATGYAGASLYVHEAAVTDDLLITAGATGALEFAQHIFQCLDLFAPDTLAAWYGLFKTGQADYFSALMRATGGR